MEGGHVARLALRARPERVRTTTRAYALCESEHAAHLQTHAAASVIPIGLEVSTELLRAAELHLHWRPSGRDHARLVLLLLHLSAASVGTWRWGRRWPLERGSSSRVCCGRGWPLSRLATGTSHHAAAARANHVGIVDEWRLCRRLQIAKLLEVLLSQAHVAAEARAG
jgi:hypothetical protein